MRYQVAVVLAVVFAGYLEPVLDGTTATAERAARDPFFPRALAAAESWRSGPVPALVVGDGRFHPPPPDVEQVTLDALRARGDRGPPPVPAPDAVTYAFVDPATGDVAVVTVLPEATRLEVVRAPADAPAPTLVDPVLGLLGKVTPARDAPAQAAPGQRPAAPEAATCEGWWVCVRVALAAWWDR